ncbi:MAG: biliverdin-producing heme oxygenase [Actinomycetes bacterium]|nr:MAG: biliverdin-producing heme oxygenase [Actinomycetota bacterium]
MTQTRQAQGFAATIRERTNEAHMTTEGQPFVERLVEGRLPIVDYARLAAQHHAIYEGMEQGFEAATDEYLREFMVPGLPRLASLEADLVFLAGENWRDKLPLMPATRAYAEHIRRLEDTWERGLLAHHYVRYMGDLSGGQLIRRVLRRVYRFEDERGTTFYEFPEIPSAKELKMRYRGLLDDLPWGEDEKERLIAEALYAFRCHQAIYAELDGAA